MKKQYLIFAMLISLNIWAVQGQSIGNGVEINVLNNNEFNGFEMLDSVIQNARVVMTGENHTYVKFNAKMELKMLRYLNQKVGTRNFVIELGPARAHFVNRYINETDTMADRYLRATTSPRYMELFKRMKKFNRGLPDSLKITVHGIDVERFNDLPLIRLSELLPRANVPKNLRVGVDAIHAAADYLVIDGLEDYERARDESQSSYRSYDYESQPFYIVSTVLEILDYYDSLKSEFKGWLGSDFDQIDLAVDWLKEYKQWEEYENTTYQYIWREEHIFQHLSDLVKNHPGERYFGQFGRCHIAYEEQNGDCGWYGYHSVINKMRTRYFKSYDSLVTIGLFYSGNGDNNYYSDREDDKELQEEIDVLLDAANKKVITLFNLRDSAAELPRLANKFSYAIVNDDALVDDEDTAETEVIIDEPALSNLTKDFSYFGVGYTASNVSMDVLGKHITDNGFSTTLKPFHFQKVTIGYSGAFNHEGNLWYLPNMNLHSSDSSELDYQAWQVNYQMGLPLVRKNAVQFIIGGSIGYASEKISLTYKNTSFLQPNMNKNFVHNAIVLGPVAQFHCKFAKYFYFGLHASPLFDLSNEQWKFQGSSQTYGTKGAVSSGFDGFYFGGNLGFLIPINEYNYYD